MDSQIEIFILHQVYHITIHQFFKDFYEMNLLLTV